VIGLFLVLFHTSSDAKVYLDVDFKDFTKSKGGHFKQIMSAELDQKKTFALPNSNQEIEIVVSEKLPGELRKIQNASNSALIEFKFFEKSQGERKLVNAGRVVTKWGNTALMKKFNRSSGKQPLMTFKVIPTKI
jgi:hypothetical protein